MHLLGKQIRNNRHCLNYFKTDESMCCYALFAILAKIFLKEVIEGIKRIEWLYNVRVRVSFVS